MAVQCFLFIFEHSNTGTDTIVLTLSCASHLDIVLIVQNLLPGWSRICRLTSIFSKYYTPPQASFDCHCTMWPSSLLCNKETEWVIRKGINQYYYWKFTNCVKASSDATGHIFSDVPGIIGCFGFSNIIHSHPGDPAEAGQAPACVQLANLATFLLSWAIDILRLSLSLWRYCGWLFFSSLHWWFQQPLPGGLPKGLMSPKELPVWWIQRREQHLVVVTMWLGNLSCHSRSTNSCQSLAVAKMSADVFVEWWGMVMMNDHLFWREQVSLISHR